MTTIASRRALLLTSDPEPVGGAEEQLAAGGFAVRRCHDGSVERFPCAGLDGGTCPLDEPGGIDVVVDVRQHPWPDPTPFETGVTCALRAEIPLVVVGRDRHPFGRWATATVSTTADLAAVCEQAIDDALALHRAAARDAVDAVLAHHGFSGTPVEVEVRRRQNRLHVRITADAPPLVRGLAVSRAAAAVRQIDRAATAIEIDFAAPAPSV